MEHSPEREGERQSSWSAGRVIGMVFASLGGLIGLALLLGGIAVLAAHLFARDDMLVVGLLMTAGAVVLILVIGRRATGKT